MDKRRDTVSVFNEPLPEIRIAKTQAMETEAVAAWSRAGVAPQELGVFVRSADELPRARAAVEKTKMPHRVLDEGFEAAGNRVSISTMHLAKGFEFRAVAVMACDDEVVPSQRRIEEVGDEADLQEVHDTEQALALRGLHPSPR